MHSTGRLRFVKECDTKQNEGLKEKERISTDRKERKTRRARGLMCETDRIEPKRRDAGTITSRVSLQESHSLAYNRLMEMMNKSMCNKRRRVEGME